MFVLSLYERTEGIDELKSRRYGKVNESDHGRYIPMFLGTSTILKFMDDSINGTVPYDIPTC